MHTGTAGADFKPALATNGDITIAACGGECKPGQVHEVL